MKQELPFAIVLLAAGSLLWFSQSKAESDPKNAKENTALSVEKAVFGNEINAEQRAIPQSDDNAGFNSAITKRQAQQAWFGQEEVETKKKRKVQQPVVTASFQSVGNLGIKSSAKSTVAQYVHPVSDPESVKFLADVSKQLANSPSFGASLVLTGNMFGQTVSANGQYFQMGQGSSKSRIDLRFGDSDNAPTVFHLCDGRFVYNLQTSGPKSIPTFEFVDLMRVRESSGEQSQQISPTGWVATGGISSLFQHLASAFNFGELQSNGKDKILLRGSWDENALRRIVSTGNEIDLGIPVHWEKVPIQLPHAVEIVFQKQGDFGYFPKRISFQKFSIHEKRIVLQPSVTLNLGTPKPLPEINDQFFVIDSSNLESVDATDNYIERIQLFRAIPFRPAGEQNDTQKAQAPSVKIR